MKIEFLLYLFLEKSTEAGRLFRKGVEATGVPRKGDSVHLPGCENMELEVWQVGWVLKDEVLCPVIDLRSYTPGMEWWNQDTTNLLDAGWVKETWDE